MSVLFIREVFDAAKGMIIHRKMFKKLQSLVGNFSQIWLQTRYEVQIFNILPYLFGYILESKYKI